MKHRVIVGAIIKNKQREILLCKMPKDRGVFPGQWAIPGGGIDEGEKMDEALHREIWEEVGLKLTDIEPLSFFDDEREKFLPGDKREKQYLIYLNFLCKVEDDKVTINDEFEEYAWVKPTLLNEYDLNEATKHTFRKMGLL